MTSNTTNNLTFNPNTISQLSEWKNIRMKYFREFLPESIYDLVRDKNFKINFQENTNNLKSFSLRKIKSKKKKGISSVSYQNPSQKSLFERQARQSVKIGKRFHWNHLISNSKGIHRLKRNSIMMKDFQTKQTRVGNSEKRRRWNDLNGRGSERLFSIRQPSNLKRFRQKKEIYSSGDSEDLQDQSRQVINDLKKEILEFKNPGMQAMRIFLMDFLKTFLGQSIIINLISKIFCFTNYDS